MKTFLEQKDMLIREEKNKTILQAKMWKLIEEYNGVIKWQDEVWPDHLWVESTPDGMRPFCQCGETLPSGHPSYCCPTCDAAYAKRGL